MNHILFELLLLIYSIYLIKWWTKHSHFDWIASKFFKICTYWHCLFRLFFL